MAAEGGRGQAKSLQEAERIAHVDLVRHVANDADGNVGYVVEKRPKKSDGPQLQRATEVAANKYDVLFIEMEESSELLGGRVAGEAAVPLLLFGGEEVDGQGGALLTRVTCGELHPDRHQVRTRFVRVT
jgi:hypothetical protein